MQRVLVIGVESLLGASLAHELAERCELLGVTTSAGKETTAWQLEQPGAARELLRCWEPRWVVYCGPLATAAWDKVDATIDVERQARLAIELAAASSEYGCPLTVLTSDVVFRGPRMFHHEASAPQSASPRAQSCLALERALADTDALVVRTHAYGWSPDEASAGFAQRAYAALLRGQFPSIANRSYATPIFMADLADLLWHARELRLQGLYHLAGAERTSMHRFVCEMAACLGLPLPEPKRLFPENDWFDETSLSSRRARRAISKATPMLREGLERFLSVAEARFSPATAEALHADVAA